MILPSGPVPETKLRSTPLSYAAFFARGDTKILSPDADFDGADPVYCSAAWVACG